MESLGVFQAVETLEPLETGPFSVRSNGQPLFLPHPRLSFSLVPSRSLSRSPSPAPFLFLSFVLYAHVPMNNPAKSCFKRAIDRERVAKSVPRIRGTQHCLDEGRHDDSTRKDPAFFAFVARFRLASVSLCSREPVEATTGKWKTRRRVVGSSTDLSGERRAISRSADRVDRVNRVLRLSRR